MSSDSTARTILNVLLTIFGLIIAFFIIFGEIGIYGKTNEEIEYITKETAPLGEDFNLLDYVHWPEGYEIVRDPAEKGKLDLLVIDESAIFQFTLFEEKNGVIHSIEYLTDQYSKKDARTIMAECSRELSEKYTNGKGLRNYKKSRNFVYNKEQRVLFEIRMERDGDYYRVHTIITRYSFFNRLKRYLYWRFIAPERPGINIVGLFIAQ